MATREEFLWQAQLRAECLFAAVVDQGLIRPGVLESELSQEIHDLAKREFGVRRHWHKRIVRSGPNTLKSYHEPTEDRALGADDVMFVDLGPVFGEWEADFGRTYVLGSDPRKHQLVTDIMQAFAQGKALYQSKPDLTAGELYDYVAELAAPGGWTFGAPTAGHLVDEFPHVTEPSGPNRRYSIRSGNKIPLREPFDNGSPRHWILEIHFVDRERGFGGFMEELLTISGQEMGGHEIGGPEKS